MTTRYWTGVGSRETPSHIQQLMTEYSRICCSRGGILRSGGADGTDTAFELGCGTSGEIWIPWDGFNGRKVGGIYKTIRSLDIYVVAVNIAKSIHPAWDRCSRGAQQLHTRNVLQVLGSDLNTPSDFLVCWSKPDNSGDATGGTRTAWMLARKLGIPCLNLFFEFDRMRIEDVIECHRSK